MVGQMITDKMPAHILLDKESHGPEIKQGSLCIMANKRKMPVLVKIYSSTFGHYAVFYQDRKFSRPCGYTNLKHCTVEKKSDNSFRVVSQNCDAESTTFCVNNASELGDWLRAFSCSMDYVSEYDVSVCGTRSPSIPRSPLMPTLEESEEEAED